MRLTTLALVCAIAGMTAGCGTPRMASVSGGEDHALKAPEFVVKGATDFDQRWIDETTEAGVAALGWPRPKARPPEWDKPLSRNVAAVAATVKPVAAKKPRLRDRVRRLLHRKPADVEGG